ncbi:hypothetical protein [Streptomyces qinglanensis]|uniref:hypothetical protein n=1 Tax=Streptomyces qinglanensis TaxID=943816 RepID=UPI003D70BA66
MTHPDGTSGHNYRPEADAARRACQRAEDRDAITWAHTLRLRFWTVMAETDTAKLRVALEDLAAVCTAWTTDIDSRTGGGAR